ncbi:MAG: 2,3-diphosphoglycerate-dependent phosphoglycerate mutase [Bacteroidales bacterium]|jgi:2,3-bisphosphoglycerate-dependent phosphoglycerate mutase|nr:2,3-diphosphoglycerate-dependent phosphoglycerate mutase [Bacteroidales bacterium]MDY0084967.1 2,3-diphosphoglycerate-dependent phosphoglycerate mutase [Bacteroidales bacterium]
MKKLVLIRHGQSTWNKENRFTGWTDVPLSEQGVEEAKKAGKLLKEEGYRFKIAYTSYLSRAIKTLWLVLEEMDQMYIPVLKSWRLNEKHYGELQGLNKAETADKYGDEQVLLWRRSFDVPPQPLSEEDPRNPAKDPRFADVDPKNLPMTESLKEVIMRMVPYWESDIKISLEKHGEILVAAHGNSLRALVMHLKKMSEEAILAFNIPTGIPYVFEFDDDMNLQKDYFIGDPEEIKKLMDQVAKQASKK